VIVLRPFSAPCLGASPSKSSRRTCDESIAVAVAVAVADHDHDHDHVEVMAGSRG